MANIVELREMSDEKLSDRLEDLREEMFNLRFQKASAQLENTARVREVRREIAQLKELLHKRELALEAAASEIEIARVLAGRKWSGEARYNYREEAWEVTFVDAKGNELASALVNLNRKKRKHETPQLVRSYEVVG